MVQLKDAKSALSNIFWIKDVGHGQYLAPSHQFSRVSYRFSGFGIYKQMLSFFEECIIVFQAPAQFPKNKDVSNTTLHELLADFFYKNWL